MFTMACKCFFVFSINNIKGWGDVGSGGGGEGVRGKKGTRGLPSQNFSASSQDIIRIA